MKASAQERLVGARMVGAGGLDCGRRQQFHGQRLGYSSCNLGLHGEAVGQVAVVAFSPEVRLATRLDQLALEIETAMLWAELNFLLPPGHSAEESE